VSKPIGFNARQDPDNWSNVTGPLDTDGATQAVAFHENQRAEITLNDTAGALKREGGKPGQGYPAVMQSMQVRRLTPTECERLQGIPDGWTLVPNAQGKPMADSPRYKMIGNSFAVPVIRWIGSRIQSAQEGER